MCPKNVTLMKNSDVNQKRLLCRGISTGYGNSLHEKTRAELANIACIVLLVSSTILLTFCHQSGICFEYTVTT